MKTILFALCLFVVSHASPGPSKLSIGSVQSVYQRIHNGHFQPLSKYAFPNLLGEQIQVQIQDYYNENGYLAMSGTAEGSENSNFILKGEADNLYGFVVMKDKNLAFEYTTNQYGDFMVQEVPVTKIYPICDDFDGQDPQPQDEAMATHSYPIDVPHIGPYPAGQSLLKLQSLPGAKKVIYVDISQTMNGETPKVWTKEQVWQIWQGHAAGLSMYNVNVTTDPAVYAAAGVANSGKLTQGNSSGTSSCCVNCFGTTSGCTIYKKDTPRYNAGTLIHEGGHLLGLNHDGAPGVEYYGGFTAYQWLPIMGSHPNALGWAEGLWQYSKGEYATANNKEDDLSILVKKFPFREDDITAVVPLKITSGSAVLGENNWGQIATNTDSDDFSFQLGTGGGKVTLKIDRIEFIGGAMLDVDATLRDGTGKIIAQSNPVKARYAQFDTTLGAGNYTLSIKGGAEGTPANGFSNYGSMGYYGINGTIANAIVSPIQARTKGDPSIRIASVVHSLLVLDLPQNSKVENIALYSIQGGLVFQSKTRVQAIDLSQQPKGLYLLDLEVDGQKTVKSILKP